MPINSETDMSNNDITAAYRRLNASYRRVLVWRTGVDAGFFAEYTAMLHAMLYCLEHRLQFRLYSDNANFGVKKGWTDFFEPFCPEEHLKFHAKYNIYGVLPWTKLFKLPKDRRRSMAVWKLKLAFRHTVGNVLSFFNYGKRVRLSHNVHFDAHHHFCIPELGIDGDYFHAFSRMVEITWHFNAETAAEALRLEQGLGFEGLEMLAGCQIRGGDKVTETELLPPEAYVELIRREVKDRAVFVLTDDYALFDRVQILAPEIKWYTLCQPSETGYVNAGFIRTAAGQKQKQMIRFLTSMQILRRTKPFIGSITPGPSLFILKLRHPDGMAVDCPRERQAEALRLPVAGRSRIAAESTARE